ncbi:MAG: hypothetical protein PCFJNLEI_03947 [Verrucomicrobiae bacterium]|nr:hypothetical protein [Verrucomicrobiae bacterium]
MRKPLFTACGSWWNLSKTVPATRPALLRFGAIILLNLIALALPSHAATLIWTNTTSTGNYSDQSNWAPALIPGNQVLDATVFTNDTTYTVNFTANATLATNFFNGHDGIVTLALNGFTWNLTNNADGTSTSAQGAFVIAQALNTTATVYLAGGTLAVTNTPASANLLVGGQGLGAFFVTNGTVLANQTKLGSTSTGRGTLVLSGSGSTYSNSSTLQIGSRANSTGNFLMISNTAALTSMSSLTVGTTGSGGNTLLVDDGGRLFTRGQVATIGDGSSNNLAFVQGNSGSSTSTWEAGGQGISIGNGAAAGNILVVNGGIVTNVSTLNVGASTAANANQLVITNGGTVFATVIRLGGNTAAGSGNSNSVLLGNNSALITAGQNQIGQAGSGNQLIISNGGFLASQGGSDIMNIGVGSASSGNSLLVTGSGSTFTNTSRIHVGNAGSGNFLIITDGGMIESANTWIGASATASNNWALVRGTSSRWIIKGAASVSAVGSLASGNALTIDAGGIVDSAGTLSIGALAGSQNNSVTISNGGKLVTAGLLTVGNAVGAAGNAYNVGGGGLLSYATNGLTIVGAAGGGFNTMTVTNADVQSAGLLIGSGSSNNLVTVQDGVIWTLLGQLSFGAGTGNVLRVNSATSVVQAGGLGLFGNGLTYTMTNNVLSSTGANVMNARVSWVGGSITLAGLGNNSLTLSNQLYTASGASFVGNGASNNMMTVLADTVWNGGGQNLTVGNNAANGNVLTVAGGQLTNFGLVAVGVGGGSVNTMTLTNAKVQSGGLTIGNNATQNIVTVLADTVWDGGAGRLIIGTNNATLAPAGNLLIINGGTMTNFSEGIVGALGALSGNRLVVSNGGLLVNSGLLTIGRYWTQNSMWIASSGTVQSATGVVGGPFTAFANSTTVTDTGSTWRVTGGLTVGPGSNQGGQHQLIVSNGAMVISGSGAIATGAGTKTNRIIITGSGSTWTNGGNLNIGSGSDTVSNEVLVSQGGTVVSIGLLEVSRGSSANNNGLVVTDPGSTLTNTGEIRLYNAKSYLVVSNGAKVFQLGNSSTLTIGSNDRGSLLWITSSGMVVSAYAKFGVSSGNSPGNSTGIVTGVGSVWSNSFDIDFNGGVSHALIVSNGGQVVIGGGLNIKSSQRMIITSSGVVASATAYLGSGSQVTIADPGSIWINASILNVGTTTGVAANNQVIISNGASLFNGGAFNVGATVNASNNSVRVLDGGLLEANTLSVGYAAGNTISNRSGIFQFTTAAPGVSAAGVAIDTGIISFRAVTNANVWGNWAGTRGTQLTNMSFAGANAFRLNGASNRLDAVGGVDQSYTFNTGFGATNYTRLEMINGQTAYRNGNVNIGSGGSFLASNTLATITGSFTNIGAADIVDATVDFQTALHVGGTLTLRNGFVAGPGSKTVAGNLRGNGSVVGDMTIGGNVSPGFSLGTLVFSNNLSLTGTYIAELDGTSTGGADQLVVAGTLTLSGATLNLSELESADDDAYVLVTYGNLAGDQIFTTVLGLPTGYHLDYNYNSLNQIAVVIPEPGPLALVGLGLLALVGVSQWLRKPNR